MRTRKLMTVTSLAAAVGLAAAGCGGGAAAGGGSGTVVYWDTSNSTEHAVFAEIAKSCASKGGYHVKDEVVSFDQALNNFKTAAQGGNGPDVLRADIGWIPGLAKAGLLTNLSNTAVSKDLSAYNPAVVASVKYQGSVYAVPGTVDVIALYYNKKKLAAVGLTPPKTWQQLMTEAGKLGGTGAMFFNNDGYYALPFIYGAGGSLIDTDSKKVVVDSSQAVAGLRIARKLLTSKSARTALDHANSYANMKTAFKSGKVAMIMDGPWANKELLEGSAFASHPDNLGVTAVPASTAGASETPMGGQEYAVRKGTDVRKNAIAFARCMSSAKSQATIATRLGDLPTRTAVLKKPSVAKQPIVDEFAPLLATAHARPSVPGWSALMEKLTTAYSSVLAGKAAPRQAMSRLAGTYRHMLAPYGIK